ncbi:General stress protein, Gls24 family [Streptococcus acidominimus]|uniref:Stress response regulator gls24 homolog n=1 Tax=Streptococcus acidominimus TaxID=1326 RepID=A0A239X129_STRAI|nr:Asp23/Gls24 family envelope stress response protein [Streptococcus acidominimus]SNV40362.1 General stress protein, Gls24 family [Streptococcus acidominimus]
MSEIKSTVTYDEKVIQKIVGHALENIDGLLAISGGFFANVKDKLVNSDDVTTGVNVEVGKEEVATDLDIVVEYGKDIPSIAEGIKTIVAQNVEVMTHLKVVEVNVNVVDIMSREEYETSSVTVQDRVEAGYEKAKEATAAGYEYTKEAAQTAGEYISEKASDAKEFTAEKAKDVKDFTAEKASDAKEFTAEKTEEAKQYASEKKAQAKDAIAQEDNSEVTYTASSDSDVVVAD